MAALLFGSLKKKDKDWQQYYYTIMEKKEIQAKQYGVLRKAVFFVIIYKILIIATKSSSIFCRQPLN